MWVTQVLQLVPQLIMVPYLIGTIGDAGYGVYALVWSLMTSIEQLQMSLQQGVVKYSAGFLARERIGEVNRIVSSSFVYSMVLAVLACAGILIAAVRSKDPSGQIGFTLAVVGIMVLFIAPLTPYIAVIQSRQRYYVDAIAGTVSKYASLLAVMAWFHFVRPSVGALIVIMAVALFLARVAQVPVAYRLVAGLRNRPSLCNREHLRLIVTFGGAVVVIGLCLMANSTGIRWLMNSLASTSFVAHLAIMLMPGVLLSQIIGAMTMTAMPATSAYQATGNQEMLQELLIRGMRYSVILVLAGILAAILLIRNILDIWVGPDYLFLAPYTLALFAAQSFMESTAIAHHMLKGMGELRVVTSTCVVGLVLVPVGLILAIVRMGHNPYMAVTAGLVGGYLVCGCLNMAFCARATHAGLKGIFVRVYAQPLGVAAVVGLTVIGIVIGSGLEGLVARALGSVVVTLLFFIACYALIATVAERRQIKSFFSAVLGRIVAGGAAPQG